MKTKVYRVLQILVLLIVAILIVGTFYMQHEYPMVSFEELYFYMNNGAGNSDVNVFIKGIKDCFPYVLILMIIFYAIFYDITMGKAQLDVSLNNSKKKLQLYPFKIVQAHKKIFSAVLFILGVIIALFNLNIVSFIKNTFSQSKFIEENYVNPRNTQIEFEKKKNLIFIVVESLETTFFTREQGGSWSYSVTPELYDLLIDEDSITFYNENKAQGMKMIEGASWTTASVVANTTGLPFKIPIDGNSYHSTNFMNGSYALGDLLKDNGYHNELISSAKTSFGGIKEYFTKHGDYAIIDVDSAKEYNLTLKNTDKGSWGMNDNYLFNAAKERLKILSKKNQPFNMTLIGIDTHFPNGLVGDYTINKYKTQYENVYATESKLISKFIKWVKNQDFYKDTTIVIVGDHLSMQTEYFTKRNIKASDRYVYNCIINS